ncbi:MAG: RrF2 family transcriptional regulator [Pontibacterium sp.]
MQLSRFTDYTLRVLLYVAINDKQLATLGEIAEFYNISVEHLRKVVHALAKSGYLRTFRGKNGGIELAREPDDIQLYDVVAQSEGIKPLIDCGGSQCKLAGFCTLQDVLAEAQHAFLDTLRNYTLADMLSNKTMQRALIVSDAHAHLAESSIQ